jgi:hypothetical protein
MVRQGPEPQDMWQRRSPLGAGAGSGALGHVATPESSKAGRQVPELRWHVATRGCIPALCLGLKPVHGGTWYAGYRQWPPDPPW